MGHIYMRRGNEFTPADPGAVNMHDTLPPGTYTILASQAGLYLEKVDDFELPGKLYGDVNKNAERILNTFLDRPTTTGVLLSGQKGSGKTMLTKRISQKALIEHGIITILINQPLAGEGFNAFLQNISQPAVVIFDEFEKVYDRDEQQRLLTIFDGVYGSKKLFLLTCNDRYRVDSYMHNRPGRIYYSLDFAGLSQDFIAEYCADNLLEPANARGVQTVAGFFGEFTFDMLKALIEEMNRYGETATEAMRLLNMKPHSDTDGTYEISVMRDDKPVVHRGINDKEVERSPLSLEDWIVHIYAFNSKDPKRPEDGIVEDERYRLDQSKLVSVDPVNGVFVFGTDRPDTTVVFKRKFRTIAGFNYDAF
ncbi:AAA family ATPase [Magnetospirillum molischianum]|uniref:ATPase AAA-type core domain-containing protein n=1 Tax=Magnetospirillum molischianum DSM 120 TaxID=1150626 RepID=H8FYD6_MAGML|nr:AAA family ATPase [Magnetospirillum molischianum]CCG43374.1 conserved hypothetical protein [Magnetospirillum molischianum DSM 120]